MPTTVGPNTYGEENLVFGYDLGDVSNSYKGEPTTNQYTNPDFSNGTTGWTFGSWDGNISYTTATVPGPYGKDVTALKLTSNASSAYSHFHQNNSGKYTTGNQYTLSAWVKGSGTLRGNSQWGGVEQSFVLTGDWQYINYTVTAPNNSSYPYWAAETLTTGTVMYMTYAQSEQKPHATPFVGGTRSATQGLLDLTGNSTIDLTNVSFDSNAQMTFDGTDDIIQIPSATWNILTAHTLEAVFKANGTAFSGYHVMFQKEGGYSGGAVYGLRAANAGGYLSAMICYDNQSANQNNLYSSTTVTNGQYYHVVATFDSGYNWKIYINGVLENETTLTGKPYQNSSAIFVGRGDSRTMNGDLPIAKIYNRTLTASEVKSNFNAIKGRFNI